MGIWSPDDLTSLRLLVAVDESGSLGTAARLSGISQPAVTRRIHALERDVGVILVRRSSTGSHLTPNGARLAIRARRLIAVADEIRDAAAAMRENRVRRIRVAASLTIGERLVPQWLTTLRARDPYTRFDITVSNSSTVQDLVLTGEADLGFVECPSTRTGLHAEKVATDRLVVVSAPTHPWAVAGRVLDAAMLRRAPLVAREPGSGTRATLEHVLGVTPTAHPPMELGSTEAVKGAVIAGGGLAVLSELAVVDDIQRGLLVALPVEGLNLRRELAAVWRQGSALTGAEQLLLRAARANSPPTPPAI